MNLVHGLAENRIFRFLVMGGLNTAVTFGIYIALKIVLNYQIAYFLSYVFGILFAYLLSSVFVFKRCVSWRTFVRFPLVYVIQYFFGAVLLELLVHRLDVSATLAPLFVVFLTLPVTFFLTRFVFLKY